MTLVCLAAAGQATAVRAAVDRLTAADTGYVYELLRRVGASDFVARTVQFALLGPLRVVAILVLAWFLANVAARGSRRMVSSLGLRAPLGSPSERATQRVATLSELMASISKTIVWVIAVLVVLDLLDVKLGPILAGATVVGAAVGFGAQSLVRDFLSGFLIFAEDQYGIGDVIVVGDTCGTVEELNLRVTRVRALDGSVWYIPNGEIRKVGNNSVGWSRALVDVVVPFDCDLANATASIAAAADDVAGSEELAHALLEPPEVWGVDSMGAEGVTIRVAVKARSLENVRVARGLRAAIQERLRRDGRLGPHQLAEPHLDVHRASRRGEPKEEHMAGTVLYELDGHVATITYNRPEVLNAINGELREDMNAAWRRFVEDEAAWVAVVTGAGRAFCVGADLADLDRAAGSWPGSFWEIPTINSFESGMEVWKPTVAAVNGYCLGYGLTLASACDFILASDRAEFGFPEVRLGMPTIVGAIRLPPKIGWQHAMELLLTGERIGAERAKEIGLVGWVVPHDELMAEVSRLTRRLLRAAPLAARATKEMAWRAAQLDWMDAVRMGEAMRRVVGSTHDAREARAAFVEGRRPKWQAK